MFIQIIVGVLRISMQVRLCEADTNSVVTLSLRKGKQSHTGSCWGWWKQQFCKEHLRTLIRTVWQVLQSKHVFHKANFSLFVQYPIISGDCWTQGNKQVKNNIPNIRNSKCWHIHCPVHIMYSKVMSFVTNHKQLLKPVYCFRLKMYHQRWCRYLVIRVSSTISSFY